MNNMLKIALCLVAVCGIAFGVHTANAGEEAPAAAKTEAMPEMKTEAKAETATPSPIHSMMMWVGSHVATEGCGCPSTPKGAEQWGAWFEGGKDVPLAGLRNALVKDGWNKAKFVGFFKQMASKACTSGECDCSAGECDCGTKGAMGDAASGSASDSSKCEKGCCGGCDKAKGNAPTGDAASGSASDSSGCDKGCCGGCDKSKSDAPTGDAASGSASDTGCSDCPGKCSGCDKSKGCKGCPSKQKELEPAGS